MEPNSIYIYIYNLSFGLMQGYRYFRGGNADVLQSSSLRKFGLFAVCVVIP